ncbi:hypothetical protein PCE1_000765 [Barthelona sp. PCE]
MGLQPFHNHTEIIREALNFCLNLEESIFLEEFLLYSKHVSWVLRGFNSGFLNFIAQDILGNVGKIQRSSENHRINDFEQLVQFEQRENISKRDDSAYSGSIWLSRALLFFVNFFELLLSNRTLSSSKSAQYVYKDTLKTHHNFFIRKIISVGIKTSIPSRKDILSYFKNDEDAIFLLVDVGKRVIDKLELVN